MMKMSGDPLTLFLCGLWLENGTHESNPKDASWLFDLLEDVYLGH